MLTHESKSTADPPKHDRKTQSMHEEEKIEKHIFRLKLCEFIATGILLIIIFGSLFTIMIIQITIPNQSYKEAASILSTYTGIILGFVAMTVSLIGMILSFHNTIQTEKSNLSITKEFSLLSSSVQQLNDVELRLEQDLKNISDKTNVLEKNMSQFDLLKDQLKSIQTDLTQISKDLQSSVDRSKGSSTEGVQNIKPDVKTPDNIETDEKSV